MAEGAAALRAVLSPNTIAVNLLNHGSLQPSARLSFCRAPLSL